jgi:hypothetical protein
MAGFMSASGLFEGQASTTMLRANYGYFCDPGYKCGVLPSNQSQFSQNFQKLITKTNIAKIHQCFFLHCRLLCLCEHMTDMIHYRLLTPIGWPVQMHNARTHMVYLYPTEHQPSGQHTEKRFY